MKALAERTFVAPRVVRCRRPDCGRDSACRGLCPTCYRVAHQLVSERLTTWEELEKHGKAERSRRTAKVWFLEYVGH